MKKQAIQIKNKKAYHDYEILEGWECGISLLGSEVKSIRLGNVNLGGGWVHISDRLELELENVHIGQYEKATLTNHEPTRRRKLLMHKKEIIKISNKMQSTGATLVPLKLYEKVAHKIATWSCKRKKTTIREKATKRLQLKKK